MDRLKDVMWNIFQDTGNIDAYLFYRSCLDKGGAGSGGRQPAESCRQESGYNN